eukprot:7232326-Prymnesium_polylepis.1
MIASACRGLLAIAGVAAASSLMAADAAATGMASRVLIWPSPMRADAATLRAGRESGAWGGGHLALKQEHERCAHDDGDDDARLTHRSSYAATEPRRLASWVSLRPAEWPFLAAEARCKLLVHVACTGG